MKIEPLSNLRTRLRFDTRPAHEALDAFVSCFDLSTPHGLSAFVSMQHAALRALIGQGAGDLTRDLMPDLLDRTTGDLQTLRARPVEVTPQWSKQIDPMAVDYVLLGSRLGTAVLKKRWSMATDPRVRAADAYFSAPNYIDVWQDFCVTCAAIPAEGDRARTVVDDTSRLFDFYHKCAVTADNDLRTAYV